MRPLHSGRLEGQSRDRSRPRIRRRWAEGFRRLQLLSGGKCHRAFQRQRVPEQMTTMTAQREHSKCWYITRL